MKWGIVCKPSDKSFSIGEMICELLDECVPEQKFAEHLRVKGYSLKELHTMVDAFVVVGGDGTILMTLQHTSKPIFPVNTGRIGFLTEVETKNLTEILTTIRKESFHIEERIKLKAHIEGQHPPAVANDIALHLAKIGKILPMKLYVDDVLTQSLYGDGIIIATPTGSTSHALSVGGPIVDPTLDVFIIAPIAPFRHIASSMVVPTSKKITVKVGRAAKLVIDGISTYDIKANSTLNVSKSTETSRFIKLDEDFYTKVYKKLSCH